MNFYALLLNVTVIVSISLFVIVSRAEDEHFHGTGVDISTHLGRNSEVFLAYRVYVSLRRGRAKLASDRR